MSEPDESGVEIIEDDEDEETGFYQPSPGDTLDDLLELRVPLGCETHNTGMTIQMDWLRPWTEPMCIRELLQNFTDYVRFMKHKEVVMHEVNPTYVWPDVWGPVVRESRCIRLPELSSITDMRFFEARVQKTVVGHIASGRGMFLILQKESTLSRDCLYQRSTKQRDMNLAGTYGCGMKESALKLLSNGSRLKMWMPGQPLSADKPGEAWTWHLSSQEIMKVKGSMLKTYKTRDLLIAVTDLSWSFKLDTRDFLCFGNNANIINIRVKTNQDTKGYRLLLDDPRLYNYGIFVQKSDLCEEIGFGLDGEFKLLDRYRTEVDDVEGRLAVGIKVAVREAPEKIMPPVMSYAEYHSLDWLTDRCRPEDPEPLRRCRFKDLRGILVFGISKWKKVDAKSVILAGHEWTDGQKALARALKFNVYPVYQYNMHHFDTDCLHPVMDKIKTVLVQSPVRDFLVQKFGLVNYSFYAWSIEGLEDTSALEPYYIRDKEIVITAGLANDYELHRMLFIDLVGRDTPGLWDKAFQALNAPLDEPRVSGRKRQRSVGSDYDSQDSLDRWSPAAGLSPATRPYRLL